MNRNANVENPYVQIYRELRPQYKADGAYGNPMANTFLGKEIQETVSRLSGMVGNNVAMLVKDKLEHDYDATPKAMRVGTPIVFWSFVSYAIIGAHLNDSDQQRFPTLTLIVRDGDNTQKQLEIAPTDYLCFDRNTPTNQILAAIGKYEDRELFNKVFESPYHAARVANAKNNSEMAAVALIARRYGMLHESLNVLSKVNAMQFADIDDDGNYSGK